MNSLHNVLGTWQQQVDAFISPSAFSRALFVQHGLPDDRIHVKPNFVWPSPPIADESKEDYWLFVGRRTPEKGLPTLLEAWRTQAPGRLVVIGEGPIDDASGIRGVEFRGQQPHLETRAAIGKARCVIVPSEAFETFGLVVLEAFAAGVPVIASRSGGLEDLIDDRENGLLFTPGDTEDLSRVLAWAIDNPDHMVRFGERGLQRYEASYTPEENHERLLEIYTKVVRP